MALTAAVCLTGPPAQARTVRAEALTLVIDGEALAELPPYGPRREVFDRLAPVLRRNLWVVLADGQPEQRIGARSLESVPTARLHVDLRKPDFTLNIVLLPPRWSKIKVGELRLESADGKELWEESIKVPLTVREGLERRVAGLERAVVLLRKLRPASLGVTRKDPILRALLELNDIDVSNQSFLERARTLPAVEEVGDPAALVEVAVHPSVAADPELRVELLRRAIVVGGSDLAPLLARELADVLLRPVPDTDLIDLIAEGLEALGVAPGDALVSEFERLGLRELDAARRRLRFETGQRALSRAVGAHTLAAIDSARDFAAAEDIVRRTPLDDLDPNLQLALRDALYARITMDDAAIQFRRLLIVFPEDRFPPHAEDHIDLAYLEGAADVMNAATEVRLAYYREYFVCSPRAGAAERLLTMLRLEDRLEAELARRVRRVRTVADEERALTEIYGRPGPIARAALERSLVASLGRAPRENDVRRLLERHPELASLQHVARDLGLVRAAEAHVFPVALGEGESAVQAALGQAAERATVLHRRDFSPAAVVAASKKVETSTDKGFVVLKYADQDRIILKDGQVFRIVLEDETDRFHHGIRVGDYRAEAVRALGPPDDERSLMLGRRLLTWTNLHDGEARLSLVFDRGRVTIAFEDAARTPNLLASAR